MNKSIVITIAVLLATGPMIKANFEDFVVGMKTVEQEIERQERIQKEAQVIKDILSIMHDGPRRGDGAAFNLTTPNSAVELIELTAAHRQMAALKELLEELTAQAHAGRKIKDIPAAEPSSKNDTLKDLKKTVLGINNVLKNQPK